MASDLTASDLTVTVTERWIEGTKRYSRGTIAIAATNEYTTGGIPLPAVSKFGMYRSLDVLQITGSAGNSKEFLYGYDKTNYKLLLYEESDAGVTGLPEADNAEVPGARTVFFYACGW